MSGFYPSIQTCKVPRSPVGASGRELVVKVKLEGLKIARARGKYYVYRRATGETLIKGFVGNRADLEREMATPDFIAAYNRPRTRAQPASTFSLETLGGFINLFTHGD